MELPELLCPRCKNLLSDNLFCSKCGKKFAFIAGIPSLYLSDEEVIAYSGTSFPEYIITNESLKSRLNTVGKSRLNKHINLAPIGYVALLGGPMLAIAFFSLDYILYRSYKKSEYASNLQKLIDIESRNMLSEYDIRQNIKDGSTIDEMYRKNVESQEDFVFQKNKMVSETLNKFASNQMVLNVGCGGKMHSQLSKAYHDRGYEMIGVDISEEYLRQFSEIFNSKVVQANAMALPFADNSFDIVNFTDILEHLHNPFLGLREANRVLKPTGTIILTTNNRSSLGFRCINPLVLLERIISVYYDKVLPPRNIMGSWKNFQFYHTEFSRDELIRLLNTARFGISSIRTNFPTHKYEILSKILQRIPVLKYTCSEFFIIAEKK